MRKWDDDEKRDERKENQQERRGRYLVFGAGSTLVVYLSTIFLEFYFTNNCYSC